MDDEWQDMRKQNKHTYSPGPMLLADEFPGDVDDCLLVGGSVQKGSNLGRRVRGIAANSAQERKDVGHPHEEVVEKVQWSSRRHVGGWTTSSMKPSFKVVARQARLAEAVARSTETGAP